MKINFKASGVELTSNIRAYAEEKVSTVTKLLGDKDEENITYNIELDKHEKQQTGNIYTAHMTVMAGTIDKHAIGHGETAFAAIDEAKEDLTRRLRRDKTKNINMVRKGGALLKKMLRWG